MATDTTHTDANMLVVASAQDAADKLNARLRNTGHTIRVEWLTHADVTAEHLAAHPPDVICVWLPTESDGSAEGDNPDDDTTPGLDAAIDRIREIACALAPDTPVLALVTAAPELRGPLMKAGASDVITGDDTDWLMHAVERALAYSDLRRTAEHAHTRQAQMAMRLDTILSDTQDPLATIQEGVHTHVTPTYADLFGFDDTAELEGAPVMDLVAPSDRDRVKAALAACLKQNAEQPAVTFEGRRADDSLANLAMRLRPVTIDDAVGVEILVTRSGAGAQDGGATGDFSGRSALYSALDDPASGGHLGLLYIAVDGVDALQQRHGLQPTDSLLDEAAAYLTGQSNPANRCFRFGLGEFVLLTTRGDQADLSADAEALRTAVNAEAFGDELLSSPLSVSIAASELGEDAAHNQRRLLHAMRSAHELSHAGGDRASAAIEPPPADNAPAPDTESDQRRLDALRHALDNDGLALAYYRIDSLERSDRPRWDMVARLTGTETGGMTLPELAGVPGADEFMPAVDRRVIEQAVAVQSRQAEPVAMCLPLSAATLAEHDAFIDWLESRSTASGVDSSRILFRLSESVLETSVKRARSLAERLKGLGFGMALSDYGATSNATALIEQLPVDFAGLALSLTRALGGDDEDPRLAELVEAARAQGTETVAAQVPDANSMARLWQLGVHYVASQDAKDCPKVSQANVA